MDELKRAIQTIVDHFEMEEDMISTIVIHLDKNPVQIQMMTSLNEVDLS